MFDSDGSYVEDKQAWERMALVEKNGMYMLEMWTKRGGGVGVGQLRGLDRLAGGSLGFPARWRVPHRWFPLRDADVQLHVPEGTPLAVRLPALVAGQGPDSWWCVVPPSPSTGYPSAQKLLWSGRHGMAGRQARRQTIDEV